ncbi:hypothetical protein MMC24_001065 [Lignoscripta atroalba]|nr:hypothetical protein [Lignoscripta atroalba]
MAAEVSSTRLYLGNLPRDVTKEDIQAHFKTHGTGNITEVKLMNGFGFIEYDDAMDARDVVPAFRAFTLYPRDCLKHYSNTIVRGKDGTDLNGNRLTVQFARGTRPRDTFAAPDRTHPRPRRTAFRMQITGLPGETSWQDLKDFARRSGLDVVFSEVGRERDGKGFVEFETAADLKVAVDKLDNQDFKGTNVRCFSDVRAVPPFKESASLIFATRLKMRFHVALTATVRVRLLLDAVATILLGMIIMDVLAARLLVDTHLVVTIIATVLLVLVGMITMPVTATDLHPEVSVVLLLTTATPPYVVAIVTILM